MFGNATKSCISKCLKCFKDTMSLQNRTGKDRKWRPITSDDRRINRLCNGDWRISSGFIQEKMAQANVKLSARTVRRILQGFRLKVGIPR